jgi:hypothetical protein
MKRLFVLVPAILAALLVAGTAHAAPVDFPLGKPLLGHLGLWEQELNGATASINKYFGKNGASLELDAGDSSTPGSGGQVFVSTELGFLPGITNLGDITELEYSTLATTGSSAATLQVAVDLDGGLPTWDTTLVFEPTNQGPVEAWTWYRFDTLAGNWHSTQAIPGMVPQATLKSWSQIVADYPEAVVSLIPSDFGGSIRVQFGSTGGDYAGRHAHVDNVLIKSKLAPRVKFTFDGLLPNIGQSLPTP